jgi:hypothetical protein
MNNPSINTILESREPYERPQIFPSPFSVRAMRLDRACPHGYAQCEACDADRRRWNAQYNKIEAARPDIHPAYCTLNSGGSGHSFRLVVAMNGHFEDCTHDPEWVDASPPHVITHEFLLLATRIFGRVRDEYRTASSAHTLATRRVNEDAKRWLRQLAPPPVSIRPDVDDDF